MHEEIRNKLTLGYQDLGSHTVKNIAEPVRVFGVLPQAGAATTRKTQRVRRKYVRRGALSLAGLALIAAAILLVQHISLKTPRTSASIPPAQSLALSLPDKPSIAVLPFTNMSGEHEQEYFSDGLTDDLITDLSRLPGLFVIARTSSFAYKGKPAKLQDVGKELGVKYVLQGSVRKAGGQLRITVQLADASTGAELWAERYNRPLQDVFAVQDEIVRRIVTTLDLQLNLTQQGIVIPRSTENLEAYDDLLRGMECFASFTKDGNTKAREMFEKAIELDPKYAMAYAALGENYYVGLVNLFNPKPNGLEQALNMEQQALALDDSLSRAHSVLAAVYVQKEQYDEALTEARRGIALDPNSADGYEWLAEVLNIQGKAAAALGAVEKAMRLDPRSLDDYAVEQGFAYTQLGQWQESISALKPHLVRYPEYLWTLVFLTDDYSGLGDAAAARAYAAEVERIVARGPESAVGYVALAEVLNATARPSEALAAIDRGMRTAPARNPPSDKYLVEQGWAYTQLGRWQEGIRALKRFSASRPDHLWSHVFLAVDYIELGLDDAARAEVAEVLRISPQFSQQMVLGGIGRGKILAANHRFEADLRKAGLK